MYTELEKNIYNTIVYFDGMNFPLTEIEIYKYLYNFSSSNNKYTFKEFLELIKNSDFLKTKIENKESFYYLKGREAIVSLRKENYKFSYSKYEIAKKFINKISRFSCFKLISVVNTLAMDNARNESDIDLFIVAKKDRLWTARFISTLYAKILRVRPKENDTRNKICLSFYISSDNMNLEKLQKGDDVYMKYWTSQIVPVFDAKNYYQKFTKTNTWIENNLKNVFDIDLGIKRVVKNNLSKKIIRKITSLFLGKNLESILKKIQIKIFPQNIKDKLNENINNDVFIDNEIIKLHTNDRRSIYNNLFFKRCLK